MPRIRDLGCLNVRSLRFATQWILLSKEWSLQTPLAVGSRPASDWQKYAFDMAQNVSH